MLGKLDIPKLKLTPSYLPENGNGKHATVQLPLEQYEEVARTVKQLKNIKRKLAKAELELADILAGKRLFDGMRQAAKELKALDEGKLKLSTMDEFLAEMRIGKK
jgi:hypothetical protein